MPENTKYNCISWYFDCSKNPCQFAFTVWKIDYKQVRGYYSISEYADRFILEACQTGTFKMSEICDLIVRHSKHFMILLDNNPQNDRLRAVLHPFLSDREEYSDNHAIFLVNRTETIEDQLLEISPLLDEQIFLLGNFREEPDLVFDDFASKNLVDLIESDLQDSFPCTESVLLAVPFFSGMR